MRINKYFIAFITVIIFTSELFSITNKEMGIIINLAGKQRMLTQKMSKHSLLISQKIEVDKNKKALKNASNLFDKTLKGLMKGDKSLRLAATDSKMIQKQLNEVENLWKEFHKNIKAVIKGNIKQGILNNIAKQNLPLLDNMNKAVTLYVQESSKLSNLDLDMAIDINLAGKQRMLTQKMSKELLLIASNINSGKNVNNLSKTAALFDKTLKGLISGDKDLDLKGSKLNHITKQLKLIKSHWEKVQPDINKETTSDKVKMSKTVSRLGKLLVEMNDAVYMYENSIKKQVLAFNLSSIVNQAMEVQQKQEKVINLSGRQRMLTQKITKEAILIALGVDPEQNRKSMQQSTALYVKTLNGFINGDKDLELTPVKNKKILKHLAKTKERWEVFNQNVQALAKSSKIDKNALLYVIKNNEKMLQLSHKAVLLFKADAGESGISKVLANMIDVSGRQRMLTQKMTKEKLLIIGGIDSGKNQKRLNGSIKLFNRSLKGLIDGDENIGLVSTTNEEIRKQLLLVQNKWNKLRPIYQKENVSDQELSSIIINNIPLLTEMNKAVKMYEKFKSF